MSTPGRTPPPALSPGTESKFGAVDQMRLDQIRSCIVTAISVGVPVYNRGDPQGCYDVYAKAARECLEFSSTPALYDQTPTIRRALSGAIEDAQGQSEPAQQAWTMRRALDTVLIEVDGAEGGAKPTGGQPAVPTPTQSVDFTDASVAPAWAAIDDRIMGGSSRSRVVHYPARQMSEAEEIVAAFSDEGRHLCRKQAGWLSLRPARAPEAYL